jgi:hypothetical protein
VYKDQGEPGGVGQTGLISAPGKECHRAMPAWMPALRGAFPNAMTRAPGAMSWKRKRRTNIVGIGNGPARVRIYTMNRKDDYNKFTLS